MKINLKNRILFTLLVTILVWAHVLWDYFHGGIPVHYLFHDKDMPGIPNWIGASILPFYTWWLLLRIQKRQQKQGTSFSISLVFKRFLLAAVLAITIAVCFVHGIQIPTGILLGILGLGIIFPLFYSEFLLGWVLGSSFTFGAVIPMGFSPFLALGCFLLYQIGRGLLLLMRPKT